MASSHLHEFQPENPSHHHPCLFLAADATHHLSCAPLSHGRPSSPLLLEQKHPFPLFDAVSDESSPRKTEGKGDGLQQQNDQNSTHCDLQIVAASEPTCSQKGEGPLSTSSADSTKEPETFSLSTIATISTDADVLASPSENRFVSRCSCTEVKSVAEAMAARLLKHAMDNVQSQVICALQQAANETLEHLRKDAAHRILLAERKAAALEQELSMVRQHALAMLLQLKADNDSQISEMEKRCIIERKRAQDAEAKLATIQVSLRRVRVDLRKKREIIEKMQKLVQPVNAEYEQTPKGMSDTVACEGNGFRDEVHDSCVQSSENRCFPSVPGDAFPAISKITPCSAGKPDSVGETTTREIELLKNSCTEKYGDASEFEAEASMPENQSERSVSKSGSITCSQTEFVEESNEVGLMETETIRKDEVTDSKHSDYVGLKSKHIETVIPCPSDSQENQTDKESENLRVSCSPLKGIYVRRKARINGENKDNESNNLSMLKSCQNIKEYLSHEMSTQLESHLQMDMENADKIVYLQEASNRVGKMQGMDPTVDERNEFYENEMRRDVFEDDSEVNPSTAKDEDLVLLPVEHGRPDYEVATSLTKLALLSQELQNHERTISPSTMKDVFIKPGRTGLRTKRKGASFQTKVDFGIHKSVSKKSKVERDDAKTSNNSTGRSLRKSKIGKFSVSKSETSGESSRDTRRLLQGARQLLCLAEKKWG